MPRIEVELPDTVDVSKYSHGELRFPKRGEHYATNDASGVVIADHDFERTAKIVFIPRWEYPEWLGGAGIAMDASGSWYCYARQPQIDGGCWVSSYSFRRLDGGGCFPLFIPPPCTDWRKSWTPNPRWEGK